MLYIDACVLLAVLTPEAHSCTATAFLAESSAPLAISSWNVTELHSALGLMVRTKALSQAQAEAVLQGFERSLAPGQLMLELEPQDFRNANGCLCGWVTSLRAADALHLVIAGGRGRDHRIRCRHRPGQLFTSPQHFAIPSEMLGRQAIPGHPRSDAGAAYGGHPAGRPGRAGFCPRSWL